VGVPFIVVYALIVASIGYFMLAFIEGVRIIETYGEVKYMTKELIHAEGQGLVSYVLAMLATLVGLFVPEEWLACYLLVVYFILISRRA
jgi:hypothetical protein